MARLPHVFERLLARTSKWPEVTRWPGTVSVMNRAGQHIRRGSVVKDWTGRRGIVTRLIRRGRELSVGGGWEYVVEVAYDRTVAARQTYRERLEHDNPDVRRAAAARVAAVAGECFTSEQWPHDLTVVGTAALVPKCEHVLTLTGYSVTYPQHGGRWVIPATTSRDPYQRWAEEMKGLRGWLKRTDLDVATRSLLEARAVKLDHLMSMSGLGAGSRKRAHGIPAKKRLAQLREGIPDLDELGEADLEAFAQRYGGFTRHITRRDAEALVGRRQNYTKLAVELGSYAAWRLHQLRDRREGRLESASNYERILEGQYRALPEDLQFRGGG
jgi:hypothetical protein